MRNNLVSLTFNLDVYGVEESPGMCCCFIILLKLIAVFTTCVWLSEDNSYPMTLKCLAAYLSSV